MAENVEPAKRARKPNFTAAECALILETAEENMSIIRSKFSNTVTNQNKTKVWEEITTRVYSLGVCKRNVEEVKEKWRGMVTTVKKEHNKLSVQRKKTGGGTKHASPKGDTRRITYDQAEF